MNKVKIEGRVKEVTKTETIKEDMDTEVQSIKIVGDDSEVITLKGQEGFMDEIITDGTGKILTKIPVIVTVERSQKTIEESVKK